MIASGSQNLKRNTRSHTHTHTHIYTLTHTHTHIHTHTHALLPPPPTHREQRILGVMPAEGGWGASSLHTCVPSRHRRLGGGGCHTDIILRFHLRRNPLSFVYVYVHTYISLSVYHRVVTLLVTHHEASKCNELH